MAAKKTRDRALVLRRYPFGESSLVVHLLTRGHGRLNVLAKGAYRPRSRYFCVLDLFDTLEIEWRSPRRSELALLAAGEIRVRRRAIPRDLPRYRAALSILELLGVAAMPGRPEAPLFDLGERWLDLLDAGGIDPGIALVAFDLRFLHNLGLAPALVACAVCGKEASPSRRARRVAFSSGAGGLLCAACARGARASGPGSDRGVGTVPERVLRIAQSLLSTPPETLPKFRLAPGPAGELTSLLQRFLEYHLETRPRTRAAVRR